MEGGLHGGHPPLWPSTHNRGGFVSRLQIQPIHKIWPTCQNTLQSWYSPSRNDLLELFLPVPQLPLHSHTLQLHYTAGLPSVQDVPDIPNIWKASLLLEYSQSAFPVWIEFLPLEYPKARIIKKKKKEWLSFWKHQFQTSFKRPSSHLCNPRSAGSTAHSFQRATLSIETQVKKSQTMYKN